MVTRASRACPGRRRADLSHLAGGAPCPRALSGTASAGRSSTTRLWMDPRTLRPGPPVLRRHRCGPRGCTRARGSNQRSRRLWRLKQLAQAPPQRLRTGLQQSPAAACGARTAGQSQAQLRPVRDRRLQPAGPRRGADGRRDARAGVQPAVHLRASRRRQDPPAELDREPAALPQPRARRALHHRRGLHQRVPRRPLRKATPTASRHAFARSTCCSSTMSSSSSARPRPRRSSSTPSTRSTTAVARSCSPPIALPQDLQGLEDRLRERFEAGLVADIKPPELATRLAILRKRAHHDHIELADEHALQAIAERVTLNVRALEGALIRIVAFSSLTGRPLTAELAREVLDGLYPLNTRPERAGPRSVAEIQPAACEHFGLSFDELLSPARTPRIAWPRQVAMYLARELTGESLPSIGRHFGGRDHTTVLHAWRRTTARIAADEDSREAVEKLCSQLDFRQPLKPTNSPDRPA